MLDFNPQFAPDDTAIGDQARALVALHRTNDQYRAILGRVALSAYPALRDVATCTQAGLDAGNGWRRQPDGGLRGSDWYGRATAPVMYIFVNEYHEALYLTRGTDSTGQLLNERENYTMTFDENALPPVDRGRGASRRSACTTATSSSSPTPPTDESTSAPPTSTPTSSSSSTANSPSISATPHQAITYKLLDVSRTAS
jgi:hypothetical protein